MAKKGDDFLKKLLATFKVEAGEHLKALTSGLLQLEKAQEAQEQMDIVESIFREAHSLKGAARAVNMMEIEAACQSMEGIFAALKEKHISVSSTLLDVLHQAVDSLTKLLSSTGAEGAAPDKSQISRIIQRLESVSKQSVDRGRGPDTSGQPIPVPQSQTPPLGDTVRISIAKLDALLLQAEELVSAKLTAGQRAADLRELTTALATWKKEWAKIRTQLSGVRAWSWGRGPAARGQLIPHP